MLGQGPGFPERKSLPHLFNRSNVRLSAQVLIIRCAFDPTPTNTNCRILFHQTTLTPQHTTLQYTSYQHSLRLSSPHHQHPPQLSASASSRPTNSSPHQYYRGTPNIPPQPLSHSHNGSRRLQPKSPVLILLPIILLATLAHKTIRQSPENRIKTFLAACESREHGPRRLQLIRNRVLRRA